MSLPRLILIADGFTDGDIAARTIEAARAGVPWIHLRDHRAEASAFLAGAARLAEALRDAGARVSVNTQIDAARHLGADLHVGARGPSVSAAREHLGDEALVGFSAHAVDDVAAPAHAAADYFFMSPIYPTSSKPDHPGVGLEVLAQAAREAAPRPIFALGGLAPERVAPCLRAGAHGIAVLSGILRADDPSVAAHRYLDVLTNALSPTETTL